MNKNPTISVIVPIYNAEKYLHKCIDSILAQTFTDFELLLINDGSKDNSGIICDEYAKKDTRIKVFQKENGGVSSARNIGIENAIGFYISFIDSDDWIDQDYLDSFLQKSEVCSLYIQGIIREGINGQSLMKFNDIIYSKDEISNIFEYENIIRSCYPFAKLFSANIIFLNNIRFNEDIQYGEDLLFLLEYLQYIDNVQFISKTFYHYAVHSTNSLSKKYYPYNIEMHTYRLAQHTLVCISEKFELTKKALSINYSSILLFLVRALRSLYRPDFKKTKNDRISILKDFINSKDKDLFKEYYTPTFIGDKIFHFLISNNQVLLFDIYSQFAFSIRYTLNNYWIRYRQKTL